MAPRRSWRGLRDTASRDPKSLNCRKAGRPVGRPGWDRTQEGRTVNARRKIIVAAEGIQAAALAALVLGGAVCFGGAVWWARPAIVWLAFLLVGARLVHVLAEGRMPFVKSPLTLLGMLLLALGVVQSVPLPARLAG